MLSFHSLTANESVLSWWFRDKNASLIVDETLSVSLTLTDDYRAWEIFISGKNLTNIILVIVGYMLNLHCGGCVEGNHDHRL